MMKQLRSKTCLTVIIAFMAIMAVTISGCTKAKEKGPEIIKIGAILPLTGKASFLGEEEKKGIDLALEEIKRDIVDKKLNFDVKIIYEDSQNQGKEAINAFNKLYNIDKIDAAVITHSGVCGPISEYISNLEQKKLPLLIGTIVASTKITQNNKVFFRLYPSGAQEAIPMAKNAFNELTLKKIAIFYQNDDYGLDGLNNFKKAFSKLGGVIEISQAFNKDARDHKNVLKTIFAKDVQAIYVIGNTPAYALAIKQAKELQFDGIVMTGSAIMVPKLKELASEGIKNIYYSSTLFDVPAENRTPEIKEYIKKFSNKFKTKPSFLSVFTYTGMKLIFQGILDSKQKNMSLLNAVKTIHDFKSPIGVISFDGGQEANLKIAIQKIDESGKQILIGEY